MFEEYEDMRRHAYESCLLIESPENYPEDAQFHDTAAQTALTRVSQHFTSYRVAPGEVSVIHRYSPWSWIIR